MAKLPSNKTIKDLAELLGETGLTEIEIETGDMRIKVARQGTAVSAVVPAAAPMAAPAAPEAALTSDNVSDTPPADHPGGVKSPMVGTAYLAPRPMAATAIASTHNSTALTV
ncbi:hypothetical protein N9W39_02540 [Alphaproteobacteria bacterium]|nr:hypothetical protein [Alphaproteobacteria bacterium]